jgi:UDP-N-acetylglucosamine transferase subunit ALG13
MIFVTIGTSEPFDRLVLALDRVSLDEEIVVQCGETSVRPTSGTHVEFLPFDDLVEYLRRARVVVTHAGVGSIMAALANGKRPVVVPRLRRYGEAVDDHQLAFARRLDDAGLVRLVEDPDDLAPALAEDGGGRVAPGAGRSPLVDELYDYLTREAGLEPTAGARR